MTCKVTHLEDGEKAINYLAGYTPYHDREKHPLPSLILLDIKMPKYTGFDVLHWIHSQPNLTGIPVIILTGSIYDEDRQRAVRLGAIGFEVKPVAIHQMTSIMDRLKLRLPNNPSGL